MVIPDVSLSPELPPRLLSLSLSPVASDTLTVNRAHPLDRRILIVDSYLTAKPFY